MTDKLIEVRDLSLRIPGTGNSQLSLLSNVSFDIEKGETVALVGESGSGKSMTAFSLIKLLPETLAPRLTGSVRFRGAEVLAMSDRALQSLRGNKITMIFQEPMTSLNPLTPVGKQIAENIRTHRKVSHKAAMQEALELLRQVKMPDPETRMTSYPHQLSGGQRQRVMIAMAVANKPDLLIADEPTTALDVTTQAQILELLKGLQQDYGMAILFITHDLGVVRAFADRVCVMKTGEIVETGVVSEIFRAPKAAYTRHLLESEPKGRKPPVSPDAPVVLDVKDLRVTFHQPVGFLGRKRQIRALDGVSLTLRQGQTLAVVGESGAGKSTVGKAILQLTKCQGEITFLGKEIDTRSRAGMRAFRRNMQVVFQDPYGALSPRMSIGEFITEPLLVHRPELSKKQRYDIASRLLSEVSLDPGHVFRYPHEFSGGQRQRIAIARAIVLEPVLVILDEPTSALDVSVQVQVIDLLRSLQERRNLTFIFISHDLKVVRALADEIIIMKDGRIVESGPTESIIENPTTDYARKLLAAAFDLTA